MMEEIDRLIDVCFLKYRDDGYENVILAREDLKAQLDSQGVVLKVEGEFSCEGCPIRTAEVCDECPWAGYSATEPLIKPSD